MTLLHLWLTGGLLMAPASADQTCAALPRCRVEAPSATLPSFAILQGDCSYRDVSARFLTGCSTTCSAPGGPTCAASSSGLHVPVTSIGLDLHGDLQVNADNHAFFVDASVQNGADRDPRHGLDTASVLFNAGHGWADPMVESNDFLDALGSEPASLSDLRLGDGDARYLLMASCFVMAHGPQTCDSTKLYHGCPQDFHPATEGRNVFARWAPRMAPGLRMACGGSTTLTVDELVPNQFWQHYLTRLLPVADSTVLSLVGERRVPLCLTHGRRSPRKTPLFDRRFNTRRNRRALRGHGRYLHAMYPLHDHPSAQALAGELANVLGVAPRSPEPALSSVPRPPILELGTPPQVPADWQSRQLGFRQVPAVVIAGTGEAGRGLTALVHPSSGAVILRWHPHPDLSLAESLAVLSHPQSFGAELSARPEIAGELASFTMRIDRVPTRKADKALPHPFEACRYVRLQRWTPAMPGLPEGAPLVGPGSEWLLASCPGSCDGAAPTAGKDCRVVGRDELLFTSDLRAQGRGVDPEELGVRVPDRPYEDAAQRVTRELRRRGYDPEGQTGIRVESRGDPSLAYFAPPLHCATQYLVPVLRYSFIEVEPRPGGERHEIDVEIPFYPDTEGHLYACPPSDT